MKLTRDGRRMKVDVTADEEGLVSHAGSALLARVTDKTGLTRALSRELDALQLRADSHDRGRVVRDLAVMLADGGDCLADLGAVRDQAALFGVTASDSTAFRVIDQIASHPTRLGPPVSRRRRVGVGVVRLEPRISTCERVTNV